MRIDFISQIYMNKYFFLAIVFCLICNLLSAQNNFCGMNQNNITNKPTLRAQFNQKEIQLNNLAYSIPSTKCWQYNKWLHR
jgi:hypothetical protein